MAKGNSWLSSIYFRKVREALRNPKIVLDNLKVNSEDEHYQYKRLYRNLYNTNFYLLAYNNIYAKPGNMTTGTDLKTIDGMSLERIKEIISMIRTESYHPTPARRKYISKKNGKLRPLGIPSIDDKLIQEIVRMILENIWEGVFLKCSHGFRPKRSCHTALISIQTTFTGVKWFVEGDIKGCFDHIDHHILIGILRKRIKDEKFISLIWKFLKAGYLDNWEYHKTISGTPQGSLISPILANIYLHELDQYMMMYKSHFDRGRTRKRNPEHRKLESRKYQLKKRVSPIWSRLTDLQKQEYLLQTKKIEKEMMKIEPTLPLDTHFKRMHYVRYADDFIIGVIGSKEDASTIKEDIKAFVRERLNLELSDEKTLVTHSKKKARFLGYDLSVIRNGTPKRNRNGQLTRAYNHHLKLYVPHQVWRNKLLNEKTMRIAHRKNSVEEVWLPISKSDLINKNDTNILKHYNYEIRGLYNYYQLACNVGSLHSYNYFMYYSLLRTLAKKYKVSVKKARKKFDVNGKLAVKYGYRNEKLMFYYDKGFKVNKNLKYTAGVNPDIKVKYRYPFGKYSPAFRLKSRECELCGAKNISIIMHHVRKLSELKPNNPWNTLMIANNRKTLATCEYCYSHIQEVSY
jgi:group II intron reverse transcriptase/maturase